MKVLGMWPSCWQFLVVLSCTWMLTHGRDQDSSSVDTPNLICNGTKALDECWNKLPPIKDHGIPSNPQAVENACKVFDSGMKCVKNWSNACLKKSEQKKMEDSVVGALEIYRFLCSDPRFRRDFLQHADCYKKISHHWDECARKFIESLRRIDIVNDVLSLCCIRFSYLHCVANVANRFCSKNATQFLQKLAETLVRSAVRNYHPSQCINFSERNCKSDASSAQSSKRFFSASPSSTLLNVLAYPKIGLVNSLKVLQRIAFVDISTLFCTLSREFASSFNYLPVDLEHTNDEITTTSTAFPETTISFCPTSSCNGPNPISNDVCSYAEHNDCL